MHSGQYTVRKEKEKCWHEQEMHIDYSLPHAAAPWSVRAIIRDRVRQNTEGWLASRCHKEQCRWPATSLIVEKKCFSVLSRFLRVYCLRHDDCSCIIIRVKSKIVCAGGCPGSRNQSHAQHGEDLRAICESCFTSELLWLLKSKTILSFDRGQA